MDEEVVIYLANEQGEEVEYVLVSTFSFNDALYMALANRSEEGVFHLIGYHADAQDRVVFDPIDDEALYDDVARVFQMELSYMEGEEIMEQVGPLDDDEDILFQDEYGYMFYVDENDRRNYVNEATTMDSLGGKDPWDIVQ